MQVSENKNTPVLTPLKENKKLFAFEKLERNAPEERTKLDEVKDEASKNKVFNNGHINKENK